MASKLDRQSVRKKKFWYKFRLDPASLAVRLTVGIAMVSALGLGSLATWTSMRMEQILVATHKENLKYIAERFPMDVEIYSEMISLTEGAQKAIDNLSLPNRLLWIQHGKEIVAKSQLLTIDKHKTSLLSLNNVSPIPEMHDFKGRSWLLCSIPLQVQNRNLGRLYIAQDITDDRAMFLSLVRSLTLATLIAIALMTMAIAWYIRRAIKPLKKIGQLTATISADKLSQARINLENAPTEVRELAETFDEMLMRLSESWERQRELLSNVSHELRTPLTIISGYLQSILRRGTNLTEMQQEALTTAASEADRTVRLLQDLLDLARADSGRMHFQLETIIIEDLILEVVAMARQYSDRKITIDNFASNIAIEVDSNRFKQVLLNLIDNAVKYSEPTTPVAIKIERQNNLALIQVCDRGVGIALQQQARIFERFYRIDEARNRSGGTGLGLSIVKTLVEGMGGNISLRSQLGKGSNFIVSFPCYSNLN
jgi:signal transduction histidine kinase